MKLTAQEEYGLRCLLQVARRAPSAASAPISIREVAEAEGLSVDYAAKLLRVLRQADLLDSERGATGGYRLARAPEEIPLSQVMLALDTPMYGAEFCNNHKGHLSACTHEKTCSLRPVWHAIEAAVAEVLARLTLAELVGAEQSVARALDEPPPRAPADPSGANRRVV